MVKTVVCSEQVANPNSKSEYRNPKQIRITKEENPKREIPLVLDLGDSDFGIVSDFDIRISSLDALKIETQTQS
jgi:hypothetical protein